MGIDPSTHGLRGYAAVFDVPDDKGTVFQRGAFAPTIERFRLGLKPIPVVYWHEIVKDEFHHATPIGVVTELREDDIGLWFESRLIESDHAEDVLNGVDAGAITAASFSFPPKKVTVEIEVGASQQDDPLIWVVDGVEVYELGPCCYGSNPDAYCEVYELPTPAAGDAAAQPSEEDQMIAALEAAAQEIANA